MLGHPGDRNFPEDTVCALAPIVAFRKGRREGRSPWQGCAMCRWTVPGLTHTLMVPRERWLRFSVSQ